MIEANKTIIILSYKNGYIPEVVGFLTYIYKDFIAPFNVVCFICGSNIE